MSTNIEKGFLLEYMVSAMFQGQGYLTRRGIPLNYGGGLEATDIDVLGVAFKQPFKGYRIICDCKNKKSTKPYERIFWSKGLGEFVNASETYVSLPRASWDIIKFAGHGGVRVITNENLESYSKPNDNYGLADQKFYGQFISQIPQLIKQDSRALECWSVSRSLWLENDPYVGVNVALQWLSIAAKQYKYTVEYSKDLSLFWSLVICDMTVNVAVQILWICSDTLGFPQKAREEHISTKMTYGSLEPRYVKDLISNFSDMANEMIKAQIPQQHLPSSPVVDFGVIPPPSYAPSIIGMVARAYNNPEWYISMPQFLDYLLFERGLKGKNVYDEKGSESIFGNDPLFDNKVKVARNIMALVRESCNVDWNLIWSNSKTGETPESMPTRRQTVDSGKAKATESGSTEGASTNNSTSEEKQKVDEHSEIRKRITESGSMEVSVTSENIEPPPFESMKNTPQGTGMELPVIETVPIEPPPFEKTSSVETEMKVIPKEEQKRKLEYKGGKDQSSKKKGKGWVFNKRK